MGVLALMFLLVACPTLKLRPLWVCAGVVITIVSVFLTDALIA